MTDTRTKEQRRRIMQAVRGQNTGPERTVRKLITRLGYRYRLHTRGLPGTPDLVFAGKRKVIFVHGCFWHFHGCRYGQAPKSRKQYWVPKLIRNRARDAENIADLTQMGWSVLVVWQCEIRNLKTLEAKFGRFLAAQIKPRNKSGLNRRRVVKKVG